MDRKKIIDITSLQSVFLSFNKIKLAYLFGSQTQKKHGPLSDYDFAIYLDPKTKNEDIKNIILNLYQKLSNVLKTNTIDIVVLNTDNNPILQFNILKTGVLIHQKEPYKLLVESKILSCYFDFKQFMNKSL